MCASCVPCNNALFSMVWFDGGCCRPPSMHHLQLVGPNAPPVLLAWAVFLQSGQLVCSGSAIWLAPMSLVRRSPSGTTLSGHTMASGLWRSFDHVHPCGGINIVQHLGHKPNTGILANFLACTHLSSLQCPGEHWGISTTETQHPTEELSFWMMIWEAQAAKSGIQQFFAPPWSVR